MSKDEKIDLIGDSAMTEEQKLSEDNRKILLEQFKCKTPD